MELEVLLEFHNGLLRLYNCPPLAAMFTKLYVVFIAMGMENQHCEQLYLTKGSVGFIPSKSCSLRYYWAFI